MVLAKYNTYDSIALQTKLMAKICAITKRGSMMAGGYSNRTRATQFNPTGMVRKYPNLQKKKIYIPELKKSITLTVSTRGLKTIQKHGAFATLKKAGLI
jgi:large subunit ribosomal protein L28